MAPPVLNLSGPSSFPVGIPLWTLLVTDIVFLRLSTPQKRNIIIVHIFDLEVYVTSELLNIIGLSFLCIFASCISFELC
uniref:Uncharacterized protein n=1 Tax=Anguilla anguilla TaxID=7936 RepID=A0A0E9XG76_ANGAN